MHCFTSSFFHSACLCCPGYMHILLFSCSMHLALPLLCLPPFIFIEFPGQLCTLIVTHPIHVMLSLFRLQPFSSSYFLRHLCVPIFSPVLCASHMPSVACSVHSPVLCFSRASAHPFLFTFHAMRLMCLMSHQLLFIFSPLLGHPSIPMFSHSMHFMQLPTICTTIQQQLQLATLTIFPSRKFLRCSFSYQLAYLRSISYHLFFFISHFLCESFH